MPASGATGARRTRARPRSAWRLALGLGGLCFALSCADPPPPLRIGYPHWPPNELARLGEALGHYDGRVEMVEFQSPAEASRAYLAGGLDAVSLTADYALGFYARDPSHRVFLLVDESLGGDAVVSRDALPSLSALAGRRIGLERSALGSHMLRRLLQRAELERADVEIVYVDVPDHESAYRDGRFDVVVTYEPTRSALLGAGGHEVFSSREIPGEIVDLYTARSEALEARAADFRAFTRGWFAAVEEFQRRPRAAAERMAPGLGLGADEFLSAMAGVRVMTLEDNRRLLGPDRHRLTDGVLAFLRSIETERPIETSADPAGLFTDELLPPESEG